MQDIINLLPVLAIAITMNLGAGMYYNIGTKKNCFDRNKMISGIWKAIIIAGIFTGSAFCFEAADLSSIGITPIFLMKSAVTVYVSKAMISLGKILGVKVETNLKE